jgi:hydroxyacylglutathione hydrolase
MNPARQGQRPARETGEAAVIEIIPIDTPALGDRSYLAHDGQRALVIDPQRDIDRVLALASSRGVTITHIFETHLHNDYVTGGLALAAATGAAYHINAADPVAFDRVPVRDGDLIEVSASLQVRVLATPGHTFTHLSYVLAAAGQPPAVFTGGSLLYGSTGRPDLLGAAHAGALARAQYASANRLAAGLPGDTEVYPTHGFGSFCSATQAGGVSSTIGQELRLNPALTLGEQEYVETLLAGLDAYPAYYAHMGPANAAGPAGADLSAPGRADAAELRRRLGAGEWVVDLRTRTAFAAGHLAGTFSFPLDGSFATYLGWLIPWGTPLILLGETPQEVADAHRELVRIGIDRPAAAATGGPADWAGGQPLRSFPVADFTALAAARHHRPVVVLDVRRNLEWAGSHIDGAVHIPLHDLLARLDDVPAGEIWVHCRTGYRSSVAASILDAAGRTVVAVDDEFDRAAAAGLPLASGGQAGRPA